MGATMEEGTYRPVGFGGAVARQISLLWVSRRPLLLMLGLIGVLGLAGEPWLGNPLPRFLLPWPIWLALVGPLWGFAVWHNEGPSNRSYFWTHPTSRTGHTIARLTAGAAWLWAVYLALILAGYLIARIDGDAAHFAAISSAAWVSLFTGPLLGYLVVSVLAVGSDYPIRWFLAILVGTPATVAILVELLEMQRFVEFLGRPLSEVWGLPVSMGAPLVTSMIQLERSVAGHPPAAASNLPYDPSVWWISMPLWVIFLAGVVFLLAWRHPDTFPRLRRG